jgi:hypothetical protein
MPSAGRTARCRSTTLCRGAPRQGGRAGGLGGAGGHPGIVEFRAVMRAITSVQEERLRWAALLGERRGGRPYRGSVRPVKRLP